jgi:CSLREA domain-containing protein
MARTRPARRLARLRLEHLEDRSVPSTFTVNTTLDDVTPANGKFSLREAITKANTTAGADVIVVPVGVFKITIAGASEDANATGDFDITDAVTIQGVAAGLTVINGQQLDRVFDVLGSGPSSIKVVLQGLTVRNGLVTGPGGGIQVGNADLVVRDCVVTGNRASESGGGIANVPGTANVTLVRTTVGRNVAGAGGGGVSATGISVLTVKSSTVRRNLAGNNGGGIFADTATLTNSTVSGNTARTDGGGLWAQTATLFNCTIAENIAQTGGGLFHNPGGTFSVKNTIVALNLVGFSGADPDVSGAFTSGGHNLIGNGTGGTGFTDGVNGDMVGTSANPIDPKLGALKNNGGRTKTHALLAGSPAIDHGDNAGVPGTDQRGIGFPRAKDGNGDGVAIVDIGAFER